MAKKNTVTNHSNLKSGFAIPSLQIDQREVVGNCDDLAQKTVESRIVTIRGQQVILDRDLAAMYQEEVSQFNRQVKRNIKRFPSDFMFQLTKEEYDGLKCHFGISNRRGGDRRALPYAFTEQGVSMLSGLHHTTVSLFWTAPYILSVLL